MLKRPPDFLAEVSFLAHEQGGRLAQPLQGYRPDIHYDEDPPGQAWMVWPRFLATDGVELPDGTVIPPKCEANFYIVDDEMRQEVHLGRLRRGTHFNIVEGRRVVASCIVKQLLSLRTNAA